MSALRSNSVMCPLLPPVSPAPASHDGHPDDKLHTLLSARPPAALDQLAGASSNAWLPGAPSPWSPSRSARPGRRPPRNPHRVLPSPSAGARNRAGPATCSQTLGRNVARIPCHSSTSPSRPGTSSSSNCCSLATTSRLARRQQRHLQARTPPLARGQRREARVAERARLGVAPDVEQQRSCGLERAAAAAEFALASSA